VNHRGVRKTPVVKSSDHDEAFPNSIERPYHFRIHKLRLMQLVHSIQASGTELFSINSSHRNYSGDGKSS
jgi:hypothetical protein